MVTVGCAGSSNVMRQCSGFEEQNTMRRTSVKPQFLRLAQGGTPGSRCNMTVDVGMVGAGARLFDSKGVE